MTSRNALRHVLVRTTPLPAREGAPVPASLHSLFAQRCKLRAGSISQRAVVKYRAIAIGNVNHCHRDIRTLLTCNSQSVCVCVRVPSRHGLKSLFSLASTLLDRPTRACGSREVPVQLDIAGCGVASVCSDWASARQHQHRQRQLTCDSDATMQATCKHSPPGRKLPPTACPNRPSASSHTVHEQPYSSLPSRRPLHRRRSLCKGASSCHTGVAILRISWRGEVPMSHWAFRRCGNGVEPYRAQHAKI